MKSTSIRLASLAALLALWQGVGSMLDPIRLSTPVAISQALLDMFQNGQMIEALEASLVVLAIGFGLSVAIGVPFGILMGRYRAVEAIFDLPVNALYVTPRVAMIPLLLIWFGLGKEAQIVVVLLGSIFPVIVNSYAGVKNIDQQWLDAGTAFSANEGQLFREVILPGALPFIATGIRVGIANAVIALIVGQMFLALSGLGYLLVYYGDFFRTDYVMATIVVIAALGAALTGGVRIIEKRWLHWSQVAERRP